MAEEGGDHGVCRPDGAEGDGDVRRAEDEVTVGTVDVVSPHGACDAPGAHREEALTWQAGRGEAGAGGKFEAPGERGAAGEPAKGGRVAQRRGRHGALLALVEAKWERFGARFTVDRS